MPVPLPDPAEAWLRGFHARHPGITADALGRGRSYAALTDAAVVGETILDLGCGDGHLLALLVAGGHRPAQLIGVDVSSDELAAASRRRIGAALLHARGQALPVRAASVDRVVSHLAFMLMTAPDQVAAELARVLRPGGRFATIVGGGPRGDDAFAGVLDLAMPVIRAAGVPRLGELRARSDAGLAGLFAAPVWTELTIEDIEVDLSGPPDVVWSTMATVYELADQPAGVLTDLRAAFEAAAPRWRRADGSIACTMATRLVTVTRA